MIFQNFSSVMVEGGAKLRILFVQEKLSLQINRVILILALLSYRIKGKSWCGNLQLEELKEQPKLKIQKIKKYQEDILLEAQFI